MANISYLEHISNKTREELIGQFGLTIWLTGLPGAGKSTIAYELSQRLLHHTLVSYVLDGEVVRKSLCSDLEYTPSSQHECTRRVAESAITLTKVGCIAIASLVSPYRDARENARQIHHRRGIPFIEVFVATPLQVCKQRDDLELYKQAEKGDLLDFVGISMPYEAPNNPEVIINPEFDSPNLCCEKIFDYLYKNNHLSPNNYMTWQPTAYSF